MSALDNLARNGIIEFDADSYVKGEKPRYVGDPDGYNGLPFERPIMAEPHFPGVAPGPLLPGKPHKDTFVNTEHEKKHSYAWVGVLAGLAATGLGVYALVNFTKRVNNSIKTKYQKTKNKLASKKQIKTPTTAKPAATSGAKPTVATPTIKTTPATTKTTAEATKTAFGQKIKNGLDTLKLKFMTLPKWAKYTAGGVAGLLGLYAIYKTTSGSSEVQE